MVTKAEPIGIRFDPLMLEFLQYQANEDNITHNELVRRTINNVFAIELRFFKQKRLRDRYVKFFDTYDLGLSFDNSSFFETLEGRVDFSISVTNIAKEILNKLSITRQFLKYMVVRDGPTNPLSLDDLKSENIIASQHYSDKPIDDDSCYLRTYANDINLYTSEIAANPTVSLTELKDNRHQMIMSAIRKAIAHILITEDIIFFECLKRFEDKMMTLNEAMVCDALRMFSKNGDCNWSHIIVNGETLNDKLSEHLSGDLHVKYDNYSYLSRCEAGHFMDESIKVHVVNTCPLNYIYLLSDSSELGILLERQPITVLPADDPKTLRLGWVIYEEIGMRLFDNCQILKLND